MYVKTSSDRDRHLDLNIHTHTPYIQTSFISYRRWGGQDTLFKLKQTKTLTTNKNSIYVCVYVYLDEEPIK